MGTIIFKNVTIMFGRKIGMYEEKPECAMIFSKFFRLFIDIGGYMCYNYSEKLVSYTLRLLQGFGADYGSQNMRVSCLRHAESAGIPDAADDRQGMGIYHSK